MSYELGYWLPQMWESWQHPLQGNLQGWCLPVFVV